MTCLADVSDLADASSPADNLSSLSRCSNLRSVSLHAHPDLSQKPVDEVARFLDMSRVLQALPPHLRELDLKFAVLGKDSSSQLACLQNLDWRAWEQTLAHCEGLNRVKVGAVLEPDLCDGYISSNSAASEYILKNLSSRFRKLVQFY